MESSFCKLLSKSSSFFDITAFIVRPWEMSVKFFFTLSNTFEEIDKLYRFGHMHANVILALYTC